MVNVTTPKAIFVLAVFTGVVFWVVAHAHKTDKRNANGYATRAQRSRYERDQEAGWSFADDPASDPLNGVDG